MRESSRTVALPLAGIALALFVMPAVLQAQAAPAVLQTMSPAEQRATGVDRLTLEERARLEAWINRLSTNVAQMAASSACQMAPTPVVANTLESRIIGDFTGFDRGTLFVLENGQVWQQTSFDRAAIYVPRPRVSFVSTRTGWRMAVDGVGTTVPVRRLR